MLLVMVNPILGRHGMFDTFKVRLALKLGFKTEYETKHANQFIAFL